MAIAYTTIKAAAASWGLSVVNLCPASAIEAELVRLSDWQDKGYAGEMEYMTRDSALFVSPARLLANAKTVVSFALGYNPADSNEICPVGFGRVARYARGRDYHRVLKKLLVRLFKDLEMKAGEGFAWRVFTDAVPLLERAVARESGSGFVGKNTMLIRQGEGSFFFLGEAVLDIEVEGAPQPEVKGSCGSCSRCLSACPTQAFVSEYSLDARRCISYLTIEKKGSLTPWEQAALGNWVFGCDICQEVCPFNHSVLKREVKDYYSAFEDSKYIKGGCLDLESVIAIRSNEEYLAQFAGTPLMRPGRVGLIRNASSVAANTQAFSLIPALVDSVVDDENSIVRTAAVYALLRLQKSCDTASGNEIKRALSHAEKDKEESIRQLVATGVD